MTEPIYNLFIFVDNGIIREVGATVHVHDGSDAEKLTFLKQQVEADLNLAKRFSLPEDFKLSFENRIERAIDYTTYRDLTNQGHALLIFEKAFRELAAPLSPLVVVTPVRNGEVAFEDGSVDLKTAVHPPPSVVHVEKQPAWYHNYMEGGFLHLDKLINDDFIEAPRILFKAGLYVSAMKLLMICVDTLSFLEFGDTTGNFAKWVDTYMGLSVMEIAPEELWEFRNSILHMTNLDSRKVKANKVRRLMFYVAGEKANYLDISDEGKYFRFKDMIDAIAGGITKWADSYNTDRTKFETLFDRYDRIISDKRTTNINYKGEGSF
jgi:hypothetical protein